MQKIQNFVQLKGISKIKTSEIILRTDPQVSTLLRSLSNSNKNKKPSSEHSNRTNNTLVIWNHELERKF